MNIENFEPLGSNCEFGFVLQTVNNNVPSLFRWTSIQIDDLCHLLDANFDSAFERDNVSPHTNDMVLDKKYGWAFHSALKSKDGQFALAATRLEKLFRIERSRLQQMIKQFRTRLQDGDVICVFSANDLRDEQIIALKQAIDRFSGHSRNILMVVSGDDAAGDEPGALHKLDDLTWRGRVAQLAPWSQANDADYDSWNKLMITISG